MSDGKKAWAEEQEQLHHESELLRFKNKVDTAEHRAEVLQLLKQARERVTRLRGCDVRLTRFEHKLLDDAIQALNKVLD